MQLSERGGIPDFAGVERLWMNHTKALLTNALLFGLLTAPCALSAQQENPHSKDAQEPVKSLGEIAKEAKKNKAVRAKAVITEETLDGQKGPLPKLSCRVPRTIKISSWPSATTRQSIRISKPSRLLTTGTASTIPCWLRSSGKTCSCSPCANRTLTTAARSASKALTTKRVCQAKGPRPGALARMAR